jgi:glycosyltransferase involved in cell wall biosynthesis
MNGLTISAIVPVYNGAAYIAEALRSIRAQTVPVTEVIVVDDGSTDDTAIIVQRVDPGAIIIRQARGGAASARNAGVSQASGGWLAFLDHDDLWTPKHNEALLDGLQKQPDAGYIYGRFCFQELVSGALIPRLQKVDKTAVPFLLHSALIRHDVWQSVGGLNPAHRLSEDIDFYLRLRDAGIRIACVDPITLIYRLHGGNLSRTASLGNAAMLEVMYDAIRRRRGSA